METKRLYIVSFGDSRKYRYEYTDTTAGSSMDHADPLKRVEDELKQYLEKEFPGEALAYYSTPKITEVNYKDLEKFADYPTLDRVELEKIKTDLKRQVEVRNQDKDMDSDAPFSNVNPSAV